MIVFKNRESNQVTDCELCDGWNHKEINSYDEDLFDDYKVAIVYDRFEEQFYVIDLLTRLILTTHFTINHCIDWLYRDGFDLIELKRKYDKVRYQEDIKHYENYKIRGGLLWT